MGNLIWSPTALNNLQLIAEYIREHNPAKEQETLSSLIAKTDQLREHPYSGQKRESSVADEDMRTLLLSKRYRLVYKVDPNDDVTILQVLDLRSNQEYYR